MNRRRFFSVSLPALSFPALLTWFAPNVFAQNKPVTHTITDIVSMPGLMETFIMPGARLGNSAMAGQMWIQIYTSAHPYEEACQFYSRDFWGDDFQTLGETGARGNNDAHSVFALHQSLGARTGVFCQRTPEYIISAFVTRGADEDGTEVTLVYEPK